MSRSRSRAVRRRPPRGALSWMKMVWGDAEGYAILQCYNPDEKQLHRREHLLWPDQRSEIEEFIRSHGDHGNVHASPLLRGGEPHELGKAQACLDGRVCWADIDKPLTTEEIDRRLGDICAVIVASGGPGRHHVYIKLDTLYPPGDIERGNKALRALLDADSAQSPAKLLAVPGTFNYKYNEDDGSPRVSYLRSPQDAQPVDLDAVLALGASAEPIVHPKPEQVRAGEPTRSVDDLPPYLQAIVLQPAAAKRGSQTYEIVAALVEHGLRDEDVLTCAEQAPAVIEKFEGRIEQEVDRVLAKLRDDHDHAGQSCMAAGCPNTPDWMETEDQPLWTPALSLADLGNRSENLEYLVDGLITHPTNGMIAGPSKAMKTQIALELCLSVASGTAFLDHFEVPEAGPVVVYVNEGSLASLKQRFVRLARNKGIDLEFPVHIRANVPGCDTRSFFDLLREDLRIYEPKLVVLDSWYAFHGANTDATNVMAEGTLLRKVQQPCIDSGVSLLIVNHFTKNAPKEPRLTSITQSGGAEWANSWLLVDKLNNTAEDVSLIVLAGGRDSGEQKFTLHARGAMLADADAAFSWEVHTQTANFEEAILEALQEHPEGLNKTEIRKAVHGGHTPIDAALKSLLEQKRVDREGHSYLLGSP